MIAPNGNRFRVSLDDTEMDVVRLIAALRVRLNRTLKAVSFVSTLRLLLTYICAKIQVLMEPRCFLFVDIDPLFTYAPVSISKNRTSVDSGFMFEDEMKTIELSQGKVAIVDDQDYEWLSQWKWYYCKGYAVRKAPREKKRERVIQMHREILKTPVGMETDHINHNTIDNRRENLRACSHTQNQGNSKIRIDNTSGFKGVSFSKLSKKWCSTIRYGKFRKNLGLYDRPEDAAIAYDRAAKEYFGEFARLNFAIPKEEASHA
jgi:hypothetical protein